MNSDSTVDCYIVPQYQLPILLPQAAVIEHIGFPELNPNTEQATPWFLGHFEWRELVLPLISMEHFGSEAQNEPIHRRGRRRVVVGHVLSADLNNSFIGIISHGIPWKTQANTANVSEVEQLDGALPFIGKVRVRTTEVLVPDLEKIGDMIAKV